MGQTLDAWRGYSKQINQLSSLQFNYDEQAYHEANDKKGWNVDKYGAPLTREAKGPPVAGGPFERVKNAVRLYQFPDPRLIQGLFDPQGALEGRNMLMRARFLGFTFFFGVRVTHVIDQVRKNSSGHDVQVWGYSYRTLTGHFEVGEIRFEVMKDLETGDVLFEINAYSKPNRIPNFFYRWGFRIFGRFLQKYFARSSIKRMQRLANQTGRIETK